LLAAMTAGSLALVLMETAPVRPNITHLAAVAGPIDTFASAISQTDYPIQAGQWRNIIIYGEPAIRHADQCHFVLCSTLAGCGVAWLRQAASETLWGCLLRLPCQARPRSTRAATYSRELL